MKIDAILLTFIAGLFILVGSLFSLHFKNKKQITDLSISIAFGVIISLVILELIPDTIKIIESEIGKTRGILASIILALIGIVILKILDIFIPHHEHEIHSKHHHKKDLCHNSHLHHIGIVSSVAIIVHNFIEGMSLYLVASNDIVAGILLCIGIGLHNFPIGFVISSTLNNSNYPRKKILSISFLVSISAFIGGLFISIMGTVSSLIEGILLGLTLGMLIYISIFELFHQMYHMKNKKAIIVGCSSGVILLLISIILEHII